MDTEENHSGLKEEIDEHTEGTLSDAGKIDNCEEKAIDHRDAGKENMDSNESQDEDKEKTEIKNDI